jgi:pheromone shutdown-related protein TraB
VDDQPTLSDNVTVLREGDRTFYLVGTAHVSEESVREVERVIDSVRPDTVCVELCTMRYEALRDDSRWRNLDIFKVIREGKTLYLLANLALGAYQRRLGADLGVKPGAELLAAAKKAEEIGARLELVDRDVQVTLRRTWANLGFLKKGMLVSAAVGAAFKREGKLTAADVEALKKKAHLTEVMKELAEVLPEVKVPLIDERDRYLMSRIQEAPGTTVVAVVGAGHVPGMQDWFGRPVDRAELERLPEPSWWAGALTWTIPLLVLAAFAVGLTGRTETSFEELLFAWAMPTSVGATLGTILALGRPLSVITTFLVAPLASLNPLIVTGMVVGPLEAWFRRPTVDDAERIHLDAQSVKGFYRNRFTRVLLVALLSTLGTGIGAWIGMGWLATKVPGVGIAILVTLGAILVGALITALADRRAEPR